MSTLDRTTEAPSEPMEVVVLAAVLGWKELGFGWH
jgi:hypothetical protein